MPETKTTTKTNSVWTEFTGPGSALKVFEQNTKLGLNASGQAPVFVTPDNDQNKKPKFIN